MKVRIIEQPTGLLNGNYWPAEGEVMELPDAVAEGMIGAGHVERVAEPAKKTTGRVESRPAPSGQVEKRGAAKPKKTAAKKS